MKRFILVLSFIASVLVLFGQGHTHIPPTFRFNGGPITIECKSNEIEKKYTRYGYITEVFNGVDISSPTQGLKRIEAPIYLEEKQGWVTITGARDESVYFSLAYVPAYSNSTTLFNDLIDCLSEVNATATTIVDTSGYYSSGTVEGALQEVGDSIDVLRTDLTAIAAGASDGVATSGAYDAGNEEIDITVAAPGSDFAIDVSDLATDSDVVDSLAQLRSEIPTNVSELTNDAGYLTSETDAIALAALGDTSTAIRADIPVNVSELTNDSGYLTTEVDGSITNELQDADEVPIDDAGGYFIGTNVEDALQNVGSTILAFSNMLASKTDSVTATLLNDSTFLINNYIGGSIFRADTIIISGGGTTYTGGYGIDITGSTIEADTSDLATQSDVVELSETIADSSHWTRIGNALFFNPVTGDTVLVNTTESSLQIRKESELAPGDDLRGLDILLRNSISVSGSNPRKSLTGINLATDGNASDLDYTGINLDLDQRGARSRLLGALNAEVSESGGSRGSKGFNYVHEFTSWPSSFVGYHGRYSEHIFPSSSTTSRGSSFFGSREIITSTGEPNTTSSVSNSSFFGISIEMDTKSLPENQQKTVGLRIKHDNAHADEYGIEQTSSTVKNYFAGRIGIGTSDVDYKLDISGSAAIHLEPHTSSLTTTSGLIYPHTTHGWKMSNASGSEMLRPALYEDTAPSDGDILVYNAANSRYENETKPDIGTGWAQYTDATFTSGSPLTVTAGDTITLPIDASTVIDTYLPDGVTSFWSVADSTITPENIGDAYTIRVSFTASSTSNDGYFTKAIDIGNGTPNWILSRISTFPKGSGTAHQFSTTDAMYSLSTFVSNGGKIKIVGGVGTTTIWDISILITRTHKQ